MKKTYIKPTITTIIVELECSITASSISTAGNNNGIPLITEEELQEVSNDWNVTYN